MFNLTPFNNLTKSLRIIILINAAFFALALMARSTQIELFHVVISLFPYSNVAVLEHAQIWRLITYMFTHFDVWHFVINMLMLWMFGDEVSQVMGNKKFTIFYLASGVFAALCSFMYGSMLGASGAIFAVMWGYAHFFPDRQILVFFIIPMQIKYAIWLFAFMDLAMVQTGGNVARWTHLAGFGAGLLFFKYIWPWYRFDKRTRDWNKRKNSSSGSTVEFVAKKANENSDTFFEDDEKLDKILKKISRYGEETLEPEEKRYLDEYSKKQQLRKGKLIDFETGKNKEE